MEDSSGVEGDGAAGRDRQGPGGAGTGVQLVARHERGVDIGDRAVGVPVLRRANHLPITRAGTIVGNAREGVCG